MFKNLLILLLSIFLLFSCSKKNKEVAISEPTEEERVVCESLLGDIKYYIKKYKNDNKKQTCSR